MAPVRLPGYLLLTMESICVSPMLQRFGSHCDLLSSTPCANAKHLQHHVRYVTKGGKKNLVGSRLRPHLYIWQHEPRRSKMIDCHREVLIIMCFIWFPNLLQRELCIDTIAIIIIISSSLIKECIF